MGESNAELAKPVSEVEKESHRYEAPNLATPSLTPRWGIGQTAHEQQQGRPLISVLCHPAKFFAVRRHVFCREAPCGTC
jgi:hypothetical protein